MTIPTSTRRAGAGLLALASAAGIALSTPSLAHAAVGAPTASNYVDSDKAVTDVALPTAQVDGMVDKVLVVDGTAYAVGKFANARPAGAALGTHETPRANVVAVDMATGEMTDFSADTDGEVKTVAVSPDHKTLYIGGKFTTVGGQPHANIAAIDLTTGQVRSDFTASASNTVTAIAASSTRVYLAGSFGKVDGAWGHALIAAVDTSGKLVNGFTATVSRPENTANPNAVEIRAMVVTADEQRVIIGGDFSSVDNTTQVSSAALDAGTGAVLPWAANKVLTSPKGGGIDSLRLDANDPTKVLMSGWAYVTTQKMGGFEGTANVESDGGAINWVEGGHGDTYDSAAMDGIVYQVGHMHSGYAEGTWGEQPNPENPASLYYHRSTAWIDAPNGGKLVDPDHPDRYPSYAGQPSNAQVAWWPTLAAGDKSGAHQAAWTVDGADGILIEGGEFPSINGRAQQGLVRFATRAAGGPTSAKNGPEDLGAISATATANAAGSAAPITVKVSGTSAWDRDNAVLSYSLTRSDDPSKVIGTHTGVRSGWWTGGAVDLSFVDNTAKPSTSYTYTLTATDPDGNATSTTVQVTTPKATVVVTPPTTKPTPPKPTQPTQPTSPKPVPIPVATRNLVAQQGVDKPFYQWTLGTTKGTDLVKRSNLALGRVTLNQAGPLSNVKATAFNGMSSLSHDTQLAHFGPTSVETMVKFTGKTGGIFISQGDAMTGKSKTYDRDVFFSGDGKIGFTSGGHNVMSPKAYNDGRWHHVVATVGAGSGTNIYVDGQLAASAGYVNYSTTGMYWRLGGDTMSTAGAPRTGWFTGTLAETAIYNKVLTPQQVALHYASSRKA